ncbi:hypothetical protein GZH47_21960 [Paenibacillus rhizovicinus]|uniref:Uncharacterized protein n=1 Tax=Paenibacillus rhizovicinus TaxID=2704463 RepID=A0A6C0P417_9BACL|nr:hypothetical protein [Paenibacillus rhizovicinus]QHW33185.1 hypothetical protein GZH47_21960 [Paenibacillus rhizovicinus]
MTNRFRWFVFVLLIASLAAWGIIYTYPHRYHLKIQGIAYQLGEGNRDYVPTILLINGTVRKNLKGVRTFIGTIDIQGEAIPVPKAHRQLHIKLSKHGEAVLLYAYNDKGQPKMFTYGTLIVNDDFSKFTILKLASNARTGQSGFDGRDGHVISAPALQREDALEITNELMRYSLQGNVLQ